MKCPLFNEVAILGANLIAKSNVQSLWNEGRVRASDDLQRWMFFWLLQLLYVETEELHNALPLRSSLTPSKKVDVDRTIMPDGTIVTTVRTVQSRLKLERSPGTCHFELHEFFWALRCCNKRNNDRVISNSYDAFQVIPLCVPRPKWRWLRRNRPSWSMEEATPAPIPAVSSRLPDLFYITFKVG